MVNLHFVLGHIIIEASKHSILYCVLSCYASCFDIRRENVLTRQKIYNK